MFAGDSIFGLLGTTMWVGGVVALGGAGAILFGLLYAATGFSGLARARSFPPPGVTGHADEVRARIRSRYMARAGSFSEGRSAPTFDIALTEDDAPRPFQPVPVAEPIAVLIAQGAEISITRLPPLNESLRRRLANRVAESPAPTPARPRKARRKARPASRSRKKVAA